MQSALILQLREGKKFYKGVRAEDITEFTKDTFDIKFFQFYDEYDELVDTVRSGMVFSAEEIEEYGWRTSPSTWKKPTTVLNKRTGEVTDRRPSFTDGSVEGQGSLKKLDQNRLPDFLHISTKNWFKAAFYGDNLTGVSESLVGAIDSSKNLNEDKFHALISCMFEYVTKCKKEDRLPRLSEEKELELYSSLHDTVLRYTAIQRTLSR